jgi:hypothetical protein
MIADFFATEAGLITALMLTGVGAMLPLLSLARGDLRPFLTAHGTLPYLDALALVLGNPRCD